VDKDKDPTLVSRVKMKIKVADPSKGS
jgi:hypothetical protein